MRIISLATAAAKVSGAANGGCGRGLARAGGPPPCRRLAEWADLIPSARRYPAEPADQMNHDPTSAPLAEYAGLARASSGQRLATHCAHNSRSNGLLMANIERRHAKFPERGIPAHLLADIARDWKATDDGFRLAFANNLKGRKGTVSKSRGCTKGNFASAWKMPWEPNVDTEAVAVAAVTERST